MKKIKKIAYYGLVIAIASLICLQAGAISTTNISSVSENKTQGSIFKNTDSFQPQRITNSLKPKSSDTVGLLGTDVILWGNADETLVCQNPTIAEDTAQKVLIGFQLAPNIFTQPDPYFRYSNDGGTTWLPEDDVFGWLLTEQGYESILPTIDFAGDKGGFGATLPDGQNNWVTLNFPDITDPDAGDAWTAEGWLADVMMEEWHSCDACGVNSEYAPSDAARGLAIWTGNTVDDGTNGLWYGWELTASSEFVVYPSEADPGYDFEADQGVNDVDLSTGMYYQAFYRYDDVGADPRPDGVFLRLVQLDGTDDWVEKWTNADHIAGAQHPDIKADGGNCYLVYELDNGVECLYSNDNGDNFQSSTVTTDGQFPSVTAIGEDVTVSYTRDGDLYTAHSDDGGATWLESSPINDVSGSAVEQTHCSDVSGKHVAWTDNRESNRYLYIYYARIGAAPFKPSKPDGPTSGRVGQSQTYSTSTVDPNGDDVSYGWDWNGDNVVDEWTDFNPSGATVSTSHTWNSDFTGEIKVKAKNTNDDEQYPILYQLLLRVLRL
jgi:hypothetical protein